MQIRSTLEFHPERDTQRMQEFWPDCQAVYRPGTVPHLIVKRNADKLLDFNELGKIAVLSGRCRNFGVHLVFQCPSAIESQMAHYGLNRIIQIETGSR